MSAITSPKPSPPPAPRPPDAPMNPRPRILLVEDDPHVSRLVAAQLEAEGFAVTVNATGGGFLEQLEEFEPRLVILDLMLPLAHGFELLRGLRQHPRFGRLPVLVLTALGDESDRIRGLDLGADDYVHKPFSSRELAARVRARLRAAPDSTAPVKLAASGLELDLKARTAQAAGRPLALSDTEYRLLAFFLKSPGTAFTRRQIVAGVWSPQHYITDRAVDVHILRLRQKIEDNPEQPRRVVAVRGVGYRLENDATA